jgi:RIO kinase 1
LYHKCKLVHGDFSEYNLLYQKETIYVIDVSQSVEHDHPHALEFLRKDVLNVIEYFRKKLTGHIMTIRELFDFVVSDLQTVKQKLGSDDDSLAEEDILNAYLDKVIMIVLLRLK